MGHNLLADRSFELIDLDVLSADLIPLFGQGFLLKKDAPSGERHLMGQLEHPSKVLTHFSKRVLGSKNIEQFSKHMHLLGYSKNLFKTTSMAGRP